MPCPSLPTELLTQIIAEATVEQRDGRHLQRNRDLRSFSLVCSQWRAVAQAELTREVTVGTEAGLEALLEQVEDEWTPATMARLKHIRFLPHGSREIELEDTFVDLLGFPDVHPSSLSLLFRNVGQHKCLRLWRYSSTCNRLTSLALAHMELQMPEWREEAAQFPHLVKLDLRRVSIATVDDDHYMSKLNNRSAEINLPLGTRWSTPQLRTLHISASEIGSLNIGDFVELAGQITDLSLGVHQDNCFLQPEMLHKFTALETFEMEWPLDFHDFDSPLAIVRQSAGSLTELRILDRHERFMTESEWERQGEEERIYVEWSPPLEGGGDLHNQRCGFAPGVDDAASDEESIDEEYEHLRRIEHVASELHALLIGNFPELKKVYLPLKFRPAVAQAEEHGTESDYPWVAELVDLLQECKVEYKSKERVWETHLGDEQLEGA